MRAGTTNWRGTWCWRTVSSRESKTRARPANFTFTLYNPSDISLRVRPEHVLEVLIANKIGQSGDLHYLYQFGFIMSLFRRTTRFHGKSIPIESS